MLYRLATTLSWIVLKLFFHFKMYNRDQFPKGSPYLLVSNHESHLDPIILSVASPAKVHFLAKEELFRNRIGGWFLRRLQAIPLRRGTSDIGVLRKSLQILKRGPIILFPQGTRGGDYNAAKAGVGFLQKKSGVPVVAARIYGARTVLPKGSSNLHKGAIKVFFKKVDTITPDDDYETISRKVIEAILSL